MSERRGKKRPKSYYRKSSHAKRQKLNTLAPGMKGFLITCNNNEKQAVRESYNILNEYADDLYGPEQISGKTEAGSDCSKSDEEEDMEKAMAKEVKAIKEQQTVRRFQNTDANAKNCIFIRTTLEDPTELHHKIFSDLHAKKVSKARFAMRMLPIAATCKAVLSDIKKTADDLFPKYFPSAPTDQKTYSVMFKVRNNSGISRDSVLPLMGEVVKSLNPLNRVNCDNPDLAILVEVICNVCCIGVSTDFHKFRKYNLHEVVKDGTKSEKDVQAKTEDKSGTESQNVDENEGEAENGKKELPDATDADCKTSLEQPTSEKCELDCSDVKVAKDESGSTVKGETNITELTTGEKTETVATELDESKTVTS